MICLKLVSQTPTPASSDNTVTLGDQVKLKISGFLKSDFYYDSRKTVDIVDGLFLFYPAVESPDANKKDINAVPLYRMSAVTSRLATKFTGPDALNAKTTAFIEFDFSGFNSIGLRLRHAYVKLNWTKDEILFGRFWHPLFITEAFPTVLALNTGAPFSVFNRTEQIRYTRTEGSLSAFIAAAYQFDYSYCGLPDINSSTYFTNYYHNSVMPDFSVNLQYKSDMLLFGATGNYKTNQPKLYTQKPGAAITSPKYVTDEKVSSMAALAYGQIKSGLLKIKGSVLYGENLREFAMVGGYAIAAIDTATGKETYSNISNISYWGNILYGDALQGGLYFGYIKNIGASKSTISSVALVRGGNIDNLMRISPSISYKTGRMQFYAEIENTIAAYGTADLLDHGKVKSTKNITDTRIQFSAFFFF